MAVFRDLRPYSLVYRNIVSDEPSAYIVRVDCSEGERMTHQSTRRHVHKAEVFLFERYKHEQKHRKLIVLNRRND